MSDPIPTDTPARRALIDLIEAQLGPCMIQDAARSTDEEDCAALAGWLDQTAHAVGRLGGTSANAAVIRAASAEIHAILRARGLIVTSRGKVIRIADDAERERRCALNREAGMDPDARHDDHERGGR